MENNLLKGKRIGFLGDSITEGVGASCSEKNYVNQFAKISGATIFNYGISGTRIAYQKNPSIVAQWDKCFLDRVSNMEESLDYVFVFGGTNDFGHGDASLGNINDTSEYCFYGALKSLILKLQNKYPYSRIVFITPLHRESEFDRRSEIGYPRELLASYYQAIKEVCALNSIPVLDLYASFGVNPHVALQKDKYLPDGLHPSDEGHARIASLIYHYLINNYE